MTDKRYRITGLKGYTIKGIKRDKHNPYYLEFYSSTGQLMFTVEEDQIFDRNGNRFEINVDYPQ